MATATVTDEPGQGQAAPAPHRVSGCEETVVVRELNVWRGSVHVLENVTFSARRGEIVLIAGPSGSGKSTLGEALGGLYADGVRGTVEGYVRVAGRDPLACHAASLVSAVGIVFQDPASQLFGLSVEGEVAAGLRSHGLRGPEVATRAEEAMLAMNVEHLRHRRPWELSSGEQQRVALAAVLAHRPPVLVLDEPTSHLDDCSCERLSHTLTAVASHGATVIVIEHRWDRLDFRPDGVYRLQEGRLERVSGGLADLPNPLPRCGGSRAGRNGGKREPLVSLDEVTITVAGRCLAGRVRFDIHRGDRVAIVGANGTGKSTLARILAGLERPAAGRRYQTGRVMLVQTDAKIQLVEDMVEAEIGDRLVMERAGLAHLARRPGSRASLGEQMRVVIAAALATRPDVLILDDPAVGQDRAALEGMLALTEDLLGPSAARVVMTHDARLARVCADEVYRLGELSLHRVTELSSTGEVACHAA